MAILTPKALSKLHIIRRGTIIDCGFRIRLRPSDFAATSCGLNGDDDRLLALSLTQSLSLSKGLP